MLTISNFRHAQNAISYMMDRPMKGVSCYFPKNFHFFLNFLARIHTNFINVIECLDNKVLFLTGEVQKSFTFLKVQNEIIRNITPLHLASPTTAKRKILKFPVDFPRKIRDFEGPRHRCNAKLGDAIDNILRYVKVSLFSGYLLKRIAQGHSHHFQIWS